jgi:hypothetical protein
MTTLPLLAHKMDRNPFAGVCQHRLAHTGLAPGDYSGETRNGETQTFTFARTARLIGRLLYSPSRKTVEK